MEKEKRQFEILAIKDLNIDPGQKQRVLKNKSIVILVAPNSCEVGAVIGKEDLIKLRKVESESKD